MFRFGVSIFGVAALICALAAPAYAKPVRFLLNKENSTLKYVMRVNQQRLKGTFENFDLDCVFDEDDLEASHILFTLDMGSLTSNSDEWTGILRSADWLAPDTYPTATFKSKWIRPRYDQGDYTAYGEFTARGMTITSTLNFSFFESVEGTRVIANVVLPRNSFGVGMNQYAEFAGDYMVSFIGQFLVEREGEKKAPIFDKPIMPPKGAQSLIPQ